MAESKNGGTTSGSTSSASCSTKRGGRQSRRSTAGRKQRRPAHPRRGHVWSEPERGGAGGQARPEQRVRAPQAQALAEDQPPGGMPIGSPTGRSGPRGSDERGRAQEPQAATTAEHERRAATGSEFQSARLGPLLPPPAPCPRILVDPASQREATSHSEPHSHMAEMAFLDRICPALPQVPAQHSRDGHPLCARTDGQARALGSKQDGTPGNLRGEDERMWQTEAHRLDE